MEGSGQEPESCGQVKRLARELISAKGRRISNGRRSAQDRPDSHGIFPALDEASRDLRGRIRCFEVALNEGGAGQLQTGAPQRHGGKHASGISQPDFTFAVQRVSQRF